MLLIYPGPHDAVEVPAAAVVAVRGVPVEVPDDIAGGLIDQGWTQPKKNTKET